MKKNFKEYHQFTEEEFQEIWKNCLFVFDTNTLLNMYRYSRTTVEAYFSVLKELKKKKQLWIPYQVGYEFYENRINVIAEYESSYDCILGILNKAKEDIESKYKDHPFLDLGKIKKQMETGLSGVEKQIKIAQQNHPKRMTKDEVLEEINKLFENNIGSNYDEEKIITIKKEGKERYEKKIPPGFKDEKKADNKKYGDLILWYQIIDKAKATKKPIILVSGDVKEDRRLEKDGKRLMPLPQLKKEMLDKAGVDFHIYTADRFLEYYTSKQKTKVDKSTITEVRKIRELEERRMMIRRMENIEREKEMDPRIFGRHSVELMNEYYLLEELILRTNEYINPKDKEILNHLLNVIREIKNRANHGEVDRTAFSRFYRYAKEILFSFERIIYSEEIPDELGIRIKEHMDRIEHLNMRLRRLI